MKRYLINLVRFVFPGTVGYAILSYLLAVRTIAAYKETGISGPGFESHYYGFAILFTVGGAFYLLVFGVILMGILTFFFRKNIASKLPLVISSVSGGLLGIWLFFLKFGFDVFVTPAIFSTGQ